MTKQVIQCTAACEVTVQHEIFPLLTLGEGAQIAGAILFIWSIAFVIRVCMRALYP